MRLKNALSSVIDNYDIIICDCPPNLTLPTQNALTISTHYMVPVTLDFLSSIGVGLLVKRVEEFSEDLEHDILQAGIIISRVGRPAIHREETESTLRNQFGSAIITDVIRERASVSKAAQSNYSIFDSQDSAAIEEFTAVCEDLLQRIEA